MKRVNVFSIRNQPLATNTLARTVDLIILTEINDIIDIIIDKNPFQLYTSPSIKFIQLCDVEHTISA